MRRHLATLVIAALLITLALQEYRRRALSAELADTRDQLGKLTRFVGDGYCH